MASKELLELTQQSETILKQISEVKAKERIEREAKEAAVPLVALYRAYINAGFTEEQSFDLVKTVISMGGKK